MDLHALARRYYALVDAADFPAMHDLFTDDCTYERPGYDPIVGREAMEAFYGGTRVIKRGRHTLRDVVVEGDVVAVHGDFDGELRDGSQAHESFADFLHYRDGLIERRRSYFFRPAV
ncbi:nuclear transport factor 2 family protein [Mariniluteicoccus flavus]